MTNAGTHSPAGGLKIALLTPDELAAALRISKSSVYRLVESRKIRFYHVAGSLRFEARDVEAFLRERCVEPAS